MSVDEMKKEAIAKISTLNDVSSLQEILDHLSRLDEGQYFDLSVHYDAIKKQYGDVLNRLAQ